jgi:hypothetical protein
MIVFVCSPRKKEEKEAGENNYFHKTYQLGGSAVGSVEA